MCIFSEPQRSSKKNHHTDAVYVQISESITVAMLSWTWNARCRFSASDAPAYIIFSMILVAIPLPLSRVNTVSMTEFAGGLNFILPNSCIALRSVDQIGTVLLFLLLLSLQFFLLFCSWAHALKLSSALFCLSFFHMRFLQYVDYFPQALCACVCVSVFAFTICLQLILLIYCCWST